MMRARAPSVDRFWRDLGYASALSSGLIADFFGFEITILATAVLTLLSGTVVAIGRARDQGDERAYQPITEKGTCDGCRYCR